MNTLRVYVCLVIDLNNYCIHVLRMLVTVPALSQHSYVTQNCFVYDMLHDDLDRDLRTLRGVMKILV